MNAIRISFTEMLKSIKSDMMLLTACLVPLLCGTFFKFGIPALENRLTSYFHRTALLSPYYGLFDSLFAILTPTMFCFAAAMVILEENDDHISTYLYITPLGKGGYIISRLAVPALLAFAVTTLLLPFFALTKISWLMLPLMAASGSTQGLIIAMMVVALSSNKVEGIAITKLASILILGIFAPYFIESPLQYLLSPFPSFWMAKSVYENTGIFLIVALGVSCIWIYILFRCFERKIMK